MMNMKKGIIIFTKIICSLLLFVSLLSLFAAGCYIDTYGDRGFDAVLYTLFAGVEGVESGLIVLFIRKAFVPAIILTLVLSLVLFLSLKKALFLRLGEKIKIKFYPFPKVLSITCSIVLSVVMLFSAAVRVDMISYIQYAFQYSDIFEDRYVDPADVNIIFPEQKQNLIYIYLESMETTFLSREQGGGNSETVIPELYKLAEENVNFSQTDSVGGFSSLSGSGWTIGALVSNTSGVPLKTFLNMDSNTYGGDSFLPGVTTLSDILHENGYYQALMVGSDAEYGSRKQYYEQHGTDKIYDLYTAREDGIVPEDYFVWWGMEDAYLFEYAKKELTEISKMDQPFAFSMLTVDTHHIGGYVCEYCGDDYSDQYANVLACSSRQVYEFVSWIQQQDFYENTTIIICGDHPTMSNAYITKNISEDCPRTVYNCFINAKAYTDSTKNRVFCTLDMFPSALAAIGCTIEGDRLGLGTNLFSSTQTQCEEMGEDVFNQELLKQSHYYTDNFFNE